MISRWISLPAAAVLVLTATVVWAALSFPELTGRVVDNAELLTPTERQSLTAMLKAHEDATTNQVVVVTLESLQGTTIEDYGYQLGRLWGIGQEGKDNGALLIVAPNERKVRIEVGYGLEGDLTDATSKLIIENIIVPAFKGGQFGPGIVAGTGAVLKALSGEEVVVPAPAKRREIKQSSGGFGPLLPMIFIGVFWLFAGRGLRGRRRGGFFPIIIPGLGGGGRRGGGGFGGGFGGGGGGFGGGGASGGW